jgi:hypothetical protein
MKTLFLLFLFILSCGTPRHYKTGDAIKNPSDSKLEKSKSIELSSKEESGLKSDSSELASDDSYITPPNRKKNSSAAGLKAGYADDNKQFGYYQSFLSKYSDIEHIKIDTSERMIIEVLDASNFPIHNADVKVYSNQN